jgi:flagellar hook-associated protein 1 FlgK
MGLFSILSVGTTGMGMAQTGMDLSSQNISNADVDGYSRKRMNLEPDYRMDGSLGQMGFGVKVINIERMRDTFIDQQIRRQNQEVGYYEEQDQTLQRIENILSEPSETGIQKFVDQFFDSWQNLANNPADLSARTMVKTSGEILTDVFHNLSGELRDLRQTRNDEIKDRVEQVNKISRQIFNLNTEIASVEIGKQNANDSRDKRDKLIKDLAKLIDIDTQENDLGQITVTTAGSILVSPAFQQNIEITSATRDLPDGSQVTDVALRFADSKRAYNPQNGQIKGLFDTRDIVIPDFENKLNTLANALVTKVNEAHKAGFSLKGYSGVDFFDPTSTGASNINVSASILSDVQNIAAATGGQIRTFTEPPPLALTFGNAPTTLTKGSILHNSATVTAGVTVLVENTDYLIDYRLGAIQMLHNGYDGTPLTIQYSYSDGSFKGPGDNANAIAVAQLRKTMTMNNDVLGNPTATFGDYYGALIGRLGLNRNEASSNLESRSYLIKQLETQQDSISGVSLDDEMSNIIKFQHMFAASARLISITSEMLDVLLRM